MEGRVTNSGWEELLAAPGKSETGKVAIWKSESCCGHPETVKCQGALKEQNITESLTETGTRIGLVSWVVRKRRLLHFRNRWFGTLGLFLN